MFRVDNYLIEEPIINILEHIRNSLHGNKLREIIPGATDITVTCPNDEHAGGNEQHADCHINIDENANMPIGVFHCFACGVSGSFIKFVALCFSSSENYAKTWLIKNYGKLAFSSVDMGDFIKLPTNKPKLTFGLDESILDSYQSWCPYLAKRKLSREACEFLKIKYDNYNRQIVFPIYDIDDKLVMLARRSIDTKFFHMDKSVEKPVYGLNIIKKNNITTCMIVEGLFDLATCYSHDVPAIATLGEISETQIELINNSGIKSLYLGFDNDSAGKKFNQFLKSKLSNSIITTDISYPAGKKDPNELSMEEWENLKEKYFK